MNRRFSILAAVAAVVAVGGFGRVDDASAEELLPPRIIAANATDPAIDFVVRRGPYSRSQVENRGFAGLRGRERPELGQPQRSSVSLR